MLPLGGSADEVRAPDWLRDPPHAKPPKRSLRPGALHVASDGKRLSGLRPISREIIRNFDSEFLKKGEEGLLCKGTVDFGDVEQAFRGETIPPGETR
jgi:hypothetical protein